MSARKSWKIGLAAAGVVCFALVASVALSKWRSDQWARRVSQIEVGMSERDARAVGGEPASVITAPFPAEMEAGNTECKKTSVRLLFYERGGVRVLAFVDENGRVQCVTMKLTLVTKGLF